MNDNRDAKIEEKFNDYESTPVPPEKHLNWIDQGTVWIGSGFSLAAISTGGILASGLDFKEMLIAMILGSLILTVISCLIGYIGYYTHLSTSFSAAFCFGRQGAKIFGVVFAISLFGWFAFQADLFGLTVDQIMSSKFNIEVESHAIYTVLGGLAMMLTAIIGYKGIQYLSRVGVPLLFILSAVALYKTVQIVSFSDIVNSGPIGEKISIPIGVAAVVGNFIVGVVMTPDFSRYSRTPKDAVAGSVLGYFIGYMPILLLGAIFTYSFSNWNIIEVMLGTLGLGMIGAIVLIISQWTTNDNNLYSSVLGLTNALQSVSKLARWKLTAIVGIISTIVAAIGLYEVYIEFLIILSSLIPPIAGVMIADFYFNKRKEYYSFDNYDNLVGFNYVAIGSWIVGGLVGLSMTQAPTGFGINFMINLSNHLPIPLVAMFASFLSYVIITRLITKKQV